MLIELIIQLVLALIGKLKASPDCPDGICSELEAKVEELEKVRASVRPASVLDFFKCVNLEAMVKHLVGFVQVVIDGLRGCGPADPDVTV